MLFVKASVSPKYSEVVSWPLSPPPHHPYTLLFGYFPSMSNPLPPAGYQVHKAYDLIFEDLLLLLTDSDSFTSDILDDKVWTENFDRVVEILKTAGTSKVSQKKRREDFLIDVLFVAVDAQDWVDVANYEAYIRLWGAATSAGFLPDCVCVGGPSPSTTWDIIPPSLKGKGLSNAGLAHPIVSQSLSAPAVATGTAIIGNGVSAQAASAALGNFLQSGTVGSALPVSVNQGTTLHPSVFPLPVLVNVSNPWVAPVDQAIYDMDKFHQSYVPTDNKMVMNVDGTFTVKSGGKKIATPEEWASAAVNLGHNMASSPLDHQFSWPVFMLWVHLTGLLFKTYSFASVIDHERAWRKWRRSTRSTWDTQNPILEKMFLVSKFVTAVFPAAGRPAATPVVKGKSPPCFDFQLSTCSRLGSCRFNHVCTRCHTTFPSATGKCPCVGGILPPGITLPAGVTFGK